MRPTKTWSSASINMNTTTLFIPYDFEAQVVKPRCRKPEHIQIEAKPLDVQIAVATKDEAPVAFQFETSLSGPKITQHTFQSRLYAIPTEYRSNEPRIPSVQDLIESLSHKACRYFGQVVITEDDYRQMEFRSVVKDGQEKRIADIKQRAARFLLIDGIVYEETAEPRYFVEPYRSLNPSVSIECVTEYSSIMPRTHYFRADEYDKALAFAKNLMPALGRQTRLFEPHHKIRILLPNMVRCQPADDGVEERAVTAKYTVTRTIDLAVRIPSGASEDLRHDLVHEALARAEADQSAALTSFTIQ